MEEYRWGEVKCVWKHGESEVSEGYGYMEGNDRWVEWKVDRVKIGGVSVKSMGRM